MLGLFDDDAGGAAESLDEVSVFVFGDGREAPRLEVDAGSHAQVGAVDMVVGAVVEELLVVVEVEGLAEFVAGGVAVESDHAEHDIRATPGHMQLAAEPRGFDLGVGVGAGQPYGGRVGVLADDGVEANGAGDAHVAGGDGNGVDSRLAAFVAASVGAVVEHDQYVDGDRGQAGGLLDGGQAVGEEALFVVGGYDHPDSADVAGHVWISPVREATERWSRLQTASRKSGST